MSIAVALVHHANQYLITNGYDNREGIVDIVGSVEDRQGMAYVLELHARSGIALNLHVSGTLLEAIAWHCPKFLGQLRAHVACGHVEVVGSCYGQNIMRFFGPDYNRNQLNEELRLFESLLGVEPHEVRTFWPPERVWDTQTMAPALRDAALLNGGYRYVILDDRTLVSPHDGDTPRDVFDSGSVWLPEVFRAHEIENGLGLVALPIATSLRRSIPPRSHNDWREVQASLESLLVETSLRSTDNLLAIYADDMEKVIGVWGEELPARYTEFLTWLQTSSWITPVKLSDWVAANPPEQRRRIEVGTFQELAHDFEAGEGYEKWYYSDAWVPYRAQYELAQEKVRTARAAGADRSLLELAEKQLLVSNWETAWHTPATGAHGDACDNGQPSPWARALTSHSRHACVTAAAACATVEPDCLAHGSITDIDHDGTAETVLRNPRLFAVFTARWGGRMVALYSLSAGRGAMVVGNPCDDWNFMEELNRFMMTPRNHPGSFADVGLENDQYTCALVENDAGVVASFTNVEPASPARGMVKTFALSANESRVRVRYEVPETLPRITMEFAFSPDYLKLLREGYGPLRTIRDACRIGYAAGDVAVWLELPAQAGFAVEELDADSTGHARVARVSTAARYFEFALAVDRFRLGESDLEEGA